MAALVPNVTDAEDIVQQTVLVLWEKFEAYDPGLAFMPWACRFALNKTRQWLERRQRWQTLLENGLAEELALRREELRRDLDRRLGHLEGCLGKLPGEQLSLLEGYYYQRDGIEKGGDGFGANGRGHLQDAAAGAARSSGVRRERGETGRSHAMKLDFPSRAFDDAVADVCHGSASEEHVWALNALLRSDPAARDEYILRVELHARLASEPDIFVATEQETSVDLPNVVPLPRRRALGWVAALAACLALLAGGWWGWRVSQRDERKGATSNAVAMLNSAVDAQWSSEEEAPRLGAPIEPRWLRLKSGLAQVVFYSGARVVIEGPAELQIISPSEASCRMGGSRRRCRRRRAVFRFGHRK